MKQGVCIFGGVLNPVLPDMRRRSRMDVGDNGEAAAGAFVPTDLAVLGEWVSIESLVSGGNGPVSSWVGEKDAYTLSASLTARPTFTTDDGDGLPALLFDGVDDTLITPIQNEVLFGPTGAYEIWIVMKVDVTSPGGSFCSDGLTNQIALYVEATNSSLDANSVLLRVAFPSASMRDNGWHVVRISKQGARRLVQTDGVTVYDASTTAGAYGTGSDLLRLGDAGGLKFLGALRHFLTTTAPLSDAEAAALLGYLEGWT